MPENPELWRGVGLHGALDVEKVSERRMRDGRKLFGEERGSKSDCAHQYNHVSLRALSMDDD